VYQVVFGEKESSRTETTRKFNYALLSLVQNYIPRHFDVVLIVSSDRFTNQDRALHEELMRVNVPCIFVRTKVDIDVSNNEEDNAKCAKETVAQIRENLRTEGIMDACLVANRGKDK
jgi:hypothetical protein